MYEALLLFVGGIIALWIAGLIVFNVRREA
jgi:hypothetical protein